MQVKIRMVVYDAAPARIRKKAQEQGEIPLKRWWNTLLDFEQRMILSDVIEKGDPGE
jgi:hypothetical protein